MSYTDSLNDTAAVAHLPQTDNIAKLGEGERVREDLHPKDLILRYVVVQHAHPFAYSNTSISCSIDHQTFRKLPKTRAIIFG